MIKLLNYLNLNQCFSQIYKYCLSKKFWKKKRDKKSKNKEEKLKFFLWIIIKT